MLLIEARVSTVFVTALALPFGLLVPMAYAALHPNHVSLAEIEFNSKTRSLEVSLCVFPEDLEQVIGKLHSKNSDIQDDFCLNESNVNKFATRWLSEEFSFYIIQDGVKKKLPVRWVGCELDVKKSWLYFEVKTNGKSPKFELENKLFLGLNDDQTNHVKFKYGSDLQWFQANNKTTKISLEVK